MLTKIKSQKKKNEKHSEQKGNWGQSRMTADKMQLEIFCSDLSDYQQFS